MGTTKLILLDSLLQEIESYTIMASATATPSVTWAQRPKIVFVTINVSDVTNPDIKVEKDSLFFKGTGGADQKLYEVTMKLFKEIDPEKNKIYRQTSLCGICLGE